MLSSNVFKRLQNYGNISFDWDVQNKMNQSIQNPIRVLEVIFIKHHYFIQIY